MAGTIDNISLGHAVNAPVDADLIVGIKTNQFVRVAVLREPINRAGALVFPGNAENRHNISLFQLHP